MHQMIGIYLKNQLRKTILVRKKMPSHSISFLSSDNGYWDLFVEAAVLTLLFEDQWLWPKISQGDLLRGECGGFD